MQKMRGKKRLEQSSSSYADCTVPMLTDEDTAKDFGTLVNAPLSKGGHFVFKSEKDWSSIDPSSEYAEFFTLNLNTLSAAIDCIPFNEYVDVDNRYFTVSIRSRMYFSRTNARSINLDFDDFVWS